MIPITFNKDDVNNLKKGNIRGQDLASILSFGIPKNSGILDIGVNPVSIINNQSGTGYATLTMSKGYVVIYGRLIYVEQGEQVQVPLPTSGTVNGVFGIRINLRQTGSNEVTWFVKTEDLTQDNLLVDEVNGIYEFGIYNYTANPSGITIGTKIAPVVLNINDFLQGGVFVTQPIDDNSTKVATTEFVQNIKTNLENEIFKGDETILLDLDRGGSVILGEYTIPDISNYKYIEISALQGADLYVNIERFSLPEIEQARNNDWRLRLGTGGYIKFSSNTSVYISAERHITIRGVK